MSLNLAIRANQLLEKGPRVVAVGKVGFEVPEEIQVAYAKEGRIALILHRGEVHAFVERGELWLTPEIQGPMLRHYFGKRR